MQNPERAVLTLTRLRELGIAVSIDDFGTGYSSLGYLKRFPIDNVKIDRSFIKDLPHDADDAAITRAVIAMAQSLRIRVIAEGVETREQIAVPARPRMRRVPGLLLQPARCRRRSSRCSSAPGRATGGAHLQPAQPVKLRA